MSFYLSQIIFVFLLPTILFGILWGKTANKHYKKQLWLFFCAIVVGSLFFKFLPYSQVYILAISSAYSASLILLFLYVLIFKSNGYFLLFWQTLIFTLAAFMWAKIAKLEMITAANVINSEFILNATAIFVGFALLIFVQVMTSKMMLGRTKLFTNSIITTLIIIALLPLSGEIVLASMKLQMMDLTRSSLSYVSKVTNFYWVYSYSALVIATICLITFYRKALLALQKQLKNAVGAIERRQTQARINRHKLCAKNYIVALLLVFISLLYWDMIASQPLKRSAATRIETSADKQVHIPITEALLDGKIHRFQWIASDGKVVRFFIIDRYPGEQKFAVVFDACTLCGDAGYTQSGDQVICLACGVHIFIPSIGKPGGCNPIPMPEWSYQDGDILISQKTLESGLQYFSDIVEIIATDPVSGEKISNFKAEHSYSFAGKSYFFTTETSYQAFRDDPWKYTTQPTSETLGE